MCQCKNNDDTINHIVYFKDSKKIFCKYRTVNGMYVDTIQYFDISGKRTGNIIYFDNKIVEEQNFENGILKHKHFISDRLEYYENDEITKVDNLIDLSTIHYYKGGRIKRFEKKCNGKVIYYNEFDSISLKPVAFYRHIEEELTVNKDTLMLKPYFPCNNFKLDDYTYSIELNSADEYGRKIFQYSRNSPVLKIKMNRNLSWNKTICDSIGCYTIPVKFN